MDTGSEDQAVEAEIVRRLDAFLRDPAPRPADLAALMRDALARGDARSALAAFDHASFRPAQPSPGPGPPRRVAPRGAVTAAILACVCLGAFARAREIWQAGMKLDPDLASLPALHRRALKEPAVRRSAEALEAAMAQKGLAAARGLLECWVLADCPDWLGIALAADVLEDAVLFLRAEEALGTPFHEVDPLLVPEPLLRAGFRARLRLQLHEEACALAARVAEALEAQEECDAAQDRRLQAWHAMRLQARAAFAPPEEALAEAARSFEADDPRYLRAVTQGLIATNEGGRLKELLAEIGARWTAPDRRPLLEAELRCSLHHRDGEAAARIMRAWTAEHGHDTQLLRLRIAAARTLSDTAALEELLQLIEPWCRDGMRTAELLRLGPLLAVTFFALTLNWPRVERLVRSLAARTDLPVAAAVQLAHVLSEAGQAAEGLALLRRCSDIHPRAPALWQALIKVHLLNGEAAEVTQSKRRLLQDLPERLRPHIMMQADPGCWDAQDVVLALRELGGGAAPRLNERIMGLLPYISALRLGLTEAILRDHAFPPRLRAMLTLVGLRAADGHRLEQAVLAPVPLTAFEEPRARTHAELAALVASFKDVPGAPLDAPGVGLARAAASLARIAKREGALLDVPDSYASALALARLLIGRIRTGTATSVLRLGDGEGLFLPPAADFGDALDTWKRVLRQTWWGDRQPSEAVFEQMVRDHQAAVDRADVVGTIPLWRMLASFDERGPARGNWPGCYNSVAYADERLRPGTTITSAHLHHELQHWNLWREIFGEIEQASWICCHDLSGYLLDHWGVRTRIGLMIPGEARFFGAFGRFGRAEAQPDGLVDRHAEVRAALTPRPGEVWLVAAGFLGKIYCDDIRQRGGIALDIGSLADYWMGYVTRGYRPGRAARTNLTNALLDGTGITPPQDRARMLGPPGPVRSTRSGRYNIGLAEPIDASSRRRWLLQAIGHPRCASGYMASVFARNGVEIGHERLLRDGISSWMNVVPDARVPYGTSATLACEYDLTVIFARDPAQAISSIILENGVEASFDFRRQHILRETGEDIAAHRSAVARAVASYVGWYSIALRRPRARVIRIEEAEQEVPRFLRDEEAAVSAWRSEPHVAPLMPAGQATTAPDEEAEATALNTSARKFSMPKPSLLAEDYAGLEAGLRHRFHSLLARLGYGPPLGLG